MSQETQTEDQLRKTYAAIEKAERGGDVLYADKLKASAKQLTAELVKFRKLKSPFSNVVAGTINAAGQGLTAGGSDEMAAFMDVNSGNSYNMDRDIRREGMNQFREDYPKLNFSADMAGSILGPGKFSKPYNVGSSTWQKAGQLLKEGGAFGFLEGLGRSESESVTDIALDTAESTAFGAGLGPLSGAAGAGVKSVGKWMMGIFRNANTPDAEKAAALILNQMEDSGITLDQVEEALKRLGPDATMVDINDTLRSLGLAVSQRSSAAHETIMGPIAERQSGAGGRIRGALNESTDVQQTRAAAGHSTSHDAPTIRRQLEADRSNSADVLYPLANSKSVPRSELSDILDNDLIKPILKELRDIDGNGIPRAIDWDAPEISVKHVNMLKMRMDDEIKNSSAHTSKNSNKSNYFQALSLQLRDRTDKLVPEYGPARRDFATRSGMVEADTAGQEIRKNTGRALDDRIDEVGQMTPSEQLIFRHSAADDLGRYATSTGAAGGNTSNKVGRLAGDSGSDRDKLLDTIAPSIPRRLQLQDNLDAESAFYDSYKTFNPQTGPKSGQYGASAGRADSANAAIEDGIEMMVLGGDPMSIMTRGAMKMLGDKKVSPNQAAEIARIMMNPRTTIDELRRAAANVPGPVAEKLISAWERAKKATGINHLRNINSSEISGGARATALGMLAE